jgi:hypothetical protein
MWFASDFIGSQLDELSVSTSRFVTEMIPRPKHDRRKIIRRGLGKA